MRGMEHILLMLQEGYLRYEIHTLVFTVLNKESNSETVHAKKHPLGKSVASFAASVNAPINCVACKREKTPSLCMC